MWTGNNAADSVNDPPRYSAISTPSLTVNETSRRWHGGGG
jgi:hypothetical protein